MRKKFLLSKFLVLLILITGSVGVASAQIAKIGDDTYSTFAAALTAANGMTGDVTVEIYDAGEFTDGMELNGSYTSINFIGKNAEAKLTVNQTAQGDYLEAHGKIVSFTDLILAKANPAWANNSGHMGNYFSIQGGTVTYTNCTFPNGACTSGATANYISCTFQNISEYGLWVYDDALVTVNGGTIDSKKGIKVYSEDEGTVTSTLTVRNATFTENVTAKPAVAVGYAQSITLIGNTYNNTTGHVELDSGSDADCEGITFVAQDAEGNDIAYTLKMTDRSNSNASCGVLCDGKIYTTVAQAAEDATPGSTVTLLYNSTETVTLPVGVTLDKNGYPADGVNEAAPVEVATYDELVAALANDGVIKLTADITTTAAITTSGVTSVVDLNGKTLTIGAGDNQFNDASNITIKNGNINITGVTVGGNAIFRLDEYEKTLVTTMTLENVNLVGDGYSSAYGIFYIGDSSVLNVIGGEWNLKNDTYTAGGVFKADDSAATLNIEGTKITAHNVRRFVTYAATEINNATIALSGDADEVDAEMEHGFNRSPLAISNSTITMTDMVGRGITAEKGAVTIANSSVTMTNVQEATIDVRGNQTVTIDSESTVTLDKEPTISNGTINGTYTLPPVAKIGETPYFTLAEAVAAAESGATITLLNGEHELPLFAGKELTFKGESKEGVIVNDAPAAVTQGWLGSTFHFENLTAKGATENYHGLANGVKAVTYNDCNINGLRFLYATNGVSFEDCTFNAEGVEHSFWTYGASNVTVKNSTFTYTDRAVNCYSENGANHEADITFEGCSFTYAGTNDTPEGAVEINSGSAKSFDIAFTDCTAPAKGAMWFNSQWDNKKGENTVVKVDNVIVWQVPAVAKIGDVEYKSLQAALDAAAAVTGNVTVEILEDINLTGIDWNPVTVGAPTHPSVTVNGNDKTITGLNDMLFSGTWAGNSGLIINDLTIANSNIVNDKDDAAKTVGVGAFIGFPQASATITLNNCHLKDSKVEGGHWTGGLIGYAAGYAGEDGPVFMNLTIKNCSVKGSTITGKGSVGGIIGHGSGNGWTDVVIEGTTVSNNIITSTGSSTNKAGAIMGTIGAAGQPTTANGVTLTGGATVSATVAGNTVTSGGTTITTIYGRQGTPTGMLELNGGSYDNYPIEKNVTYAAPAEGYEIEKNEDGTYGVVFSAVAQIGTKYYADLREAMVAAKSGETVKLVNDVDLAGTEWEPVSFNGIFDGQDHIISNLTINKPGVSNTGFITSLNGTFKNVTFTNPTVTGGDCTAVVAGRAGGGAAYAHNITINGTIKVETTHSGYARTGGIVGGWAYGKYENITIDGGDKDTSYIKYTGGGDGRYVAGIVGHADDVESYTNCTVKNITISGGWLCGGIAGPGPADGLATGCSVENIDMGADYSGGMFGWYYGDGTVKDATVKNVTFTDGSANNGIIGGYSQNTSANVENLTYENVQNSNGAPLLDHVASIGNKHYFTFEAALDAVNDGETITLLGRTGSEISKEIDFTEEITFTITGNAPNYALPVVTFQNATVNISNAKILIPELDARENATINVIDSKVYDAGGNSIAKSYYNGAINISGTSEVYMMQVTTMGYINISDNAKLHATWQTNVYGNGLITLNEGATFNTAALHLTGQDYSGRDNTDEDRIGKPAEIVVDSANFTVGKVYSAGGADYSYNSGQGINVGTVEGKSAILNIKNGGKVNIHMANGETANIGAGGTVNIAASTLNTFCRAENGTVTLANNGTVYVTGTANLAAANVTGAGWFYMNGVALDADTKLSGAKVGFINGENTIVGSTIDNGFFSVGIGQNTAATTAATFATANGITLGNVTVNVSENAIIGGNGETYSGWVGSAYSADKTQHTYTLNVENSLAAFGYMHVSKDGEMNIDGRSDEDNRYTYDNANVNFYAGDLIVNGNVTINNADAWVKFTKMSVDHADAVLNITGDTNYESSIHNGSTTGTSLVFYNAGKVNIDATSNVEIDNKTTLVEGAELNIASANVIAKGDVDVTGNGAINFTALTAKLTAQDGLTIVDGVNDPDYAIAYLDGTYQYAKYVAQIGEAKYLTLAEAFAAAQNGETITLLGNVTEVFAINNTNNVTLEMANNTLTGAVLPSTGNVTIQNGNIINSDNSHSAIEINSGSLNLNNVNISSARHAVRIDGGVTATINGGTYRVDEYNVKSTRYAVNVSGNATVTILDGTFVGPYSDNTSDSGAAVNVQAGASVTIEDGNFSGGKRNTLSAKGSLVVTGGTYTRHYNDDTTPEAFLAEGYEAVQIDENVYEVRISSFEKFYTAAGVETTQDQAAYSLMFNVTDNENNELSVKIGSKSPKSSAKLVIPSTLSFKDEELTVTSIPAEAFIRCANFVGDLEIPATVKYIGDNAFQQAYINSNEGNLILNEGLETIKNGAFILSKFHNDVLEIPSTVTFIGSHAFNATEMDGTLVIKGNVNSEGGFHGFAGSSFTKVVIKEGVTELTDISNKGVFATMTGLKEVVIPYTLTKLGAGAFSGVTTIELITSNAETAPTLGASAFTEEVKNNAVMLVPNYNNYVINGQNWGGIKNIIGVGSEIEIAGKDDKYTMIATITSMDPMECSIKIGNTKPAANSNAELVIPTSVDLANYFTIPEGQYVLTVTSIPAEAFKGCNNFVGDLVIPAKVETIGYMAFNASHNSNAGALIFAENCELTTIDAWAFNAPFKGDFQLPTSLTSVGVSAFSNNGEGATLTITAGNKGYGRAFSGSKFNKLVVEEGVESLPGLAFYNTRFTEVELPSTLTNIAEGAFDDNTSITTITSNNPVPPTVQVSSNYLAFEQEVFDNATLFVPDHTAKKLYTEAYVWKEFAHISTPIIEQTTQLNAGWNWFSYYVDTDLETLENELGESAAQIKSHTQGFDIYAGSWSGSLNEILPEQMYMINANEPSTLNLNGETIDHEKVEITLVKDAWNWIGYPINGSVNLSDAFNGVDLTIGDQIKSHNHGFAYYAGNNIWIGELQVLVKGEGYMYHNTSDENVVFTYNVPQGKSNSELKSNITSENNYWTPNASQYPNNMTMTAMVDIEGGDYEVAAFVDGEVRGSARPIYVESIDAYVLLLTIHGEGVEEMTFKFYDLTTGEEYALNDRMNYSDDAIVGSLKEPYMFNRGTTGIGEAAMSEVNIYPNPTTTGTEINLQATCDKVEVFNALGVKVAEYQNVDSIDALETAGIYVIRITNDSNVQNCRLVVK